MKKSEHWRIVPFKLWYWRRLLRVPWTARRSNQFILKEINPEYSLEGLMLKLKLQYLGHLLWKDDSLEKSAWKDCGQEEKGATEYEMVGWHHWLNGHEFEQTTGNSEGQKAWNSLVHRVTRGYSGLGNWITKTKTIVIFFFFNYSTHSLTSSVSLVAKSCLTLVNPWTVTCLDPLSMILQARILE